MLRRAENVGVRFARGVFTTKGWVYVSIGKQEFRTAKMDQQDFDGMQRQQANYPVLIALRGSRSYWQFQGKFFWENDELSADEVHALLVTRQQRERRRIDRAQAMVATGLQPRQNRRGHIPDDLRQFIWTRDEGRCRHCGSPHELQLDHIIPVSMGGATSAENLELLCGPCNRRKGGGLTLR